MPAARGSLGAGRGARARAGADRRASAARASFPGDLQCDPRAITRALAREGGARPAPRCATGCAVDRDRVAGGRVAGVRRRRADRARRRRARRRPVERARSPRAPGSPCRSSRARASSSGSPAPRPGLVRHKVVDGSYLPPSPAPTPGCEVSTVVETTWDGDVLVGSIARAPRLRPERRRGGERRDGRRAPRGSCPRLPRCRSPTAWVGFRPWLPDHLPGDRPLAARAGLWLGDRPRGRGRRARPDHRPAASPSSTAGEAPVVDLAPFDPDRFAAVAQRGWPLRRQLRARVAELVSMSSASTTRGPGPCAALARATSS